MTQNMYTQRNTCVDQDQEFWFDHTQREKREEREERREKREKMQKR